MAYFVLMLSDKVFAGASGAVHAAHCLTIHVCGDVAFLAGESQLVILGWHRADRVEVRFRGHKGDQDERGNIRVRTRDHVRGPQSGVRTCGGAVDLVLELLSCHATLPDSAPLSSFREKGGAVRVVKHWAR